MEFKWFINKYCRFFQRKTMNTYIRVLKQCMTFISLILIIIVVVIVTRNGMKKAIAPTTAAPASYPPITNAPKPCPPLSEGKMAPEEVPPECQALQAPANYIVEAPLVTEKPSATMSPPSTKTITSEVVQKKTKIPATHMQPYSPHVSVDKILAAMDSANIAFNSPRVINLHETTQIQLLLSLNKSIKELVRAIDAAGDKEGAHIKISNRMEARLSGPNFQISEVTPEEQAIGSINTVEWKWEIKPMLEGSHNLHLTLSAIFSVDGSPTQIAIRTFDKKIEVEVTMGQLLSDFFKKNWTWAWTSLLIPIVVLLRKRKNNKKSPQLPNP